MLHLKSAIKVVVRASRIILVASLVVLMPSLSLPNRVQAAAGDLDTSFGSGGKAVTDFFGFGDGGDGIVIQPDGKLIVAGSAFKPDTGQDFALARYNTDGSLDSTFGSGGKVTTDFFGFLDAATAIALQSDGKIVAVGAAQTNNSFSTFNFAIARYTGDGTLDTSFGSGGKTTTDFFGDEDLVLDVVIRSDGRIVVAGGARASSNTSDFAVARYNTDGNLDMSFGSGGKSVTDFGGIDRAEALLLQPDDKIVVVGTAHPLDPFNREFALARYHPDGSLDATFGSGGKVSTDFFDRSDGAFGVTRQTDGKILVCGQAFNEATDDLDFAFARYNTDGSLDSSFGSAGKASTDFFGSFDTASDLSLLPDGRFIAVGSARGNTGFDFAIARYNANGSLDASFGAGGVTTTDFFGDDDIANSVAFQSDGKIVAAGSTFHSDTETRDFSIARYNNALVNFDICAQDDSNGNILQINTATGEYQLTNCNGFIIGGTGMLTRRGCAITLQHNAADRRVLATIDTCQKKATASIRLLSPGRTFTITDRNIANNTCSCGN